MSSVAAQADFVNLLAAEMTSAVERAVECWLAEVEFALPNTQLTAAARLQVIRGIVEQYKTLTGRTILSARPHPEYEQTAAHGL